MSFHLSIHASARIRQRGLREDEVKFILEYGTETPKGFVITDQDCDELEAEARAKAKYAAKCRGFLVPVSNGVVKTAYRAKSRQLRKLL